jgi:hypothetical protein
VRLWRKAKQRARLKRIPFSITKEDVKKVWPEDGRCPALGIVLRQGTKVSSRASPTLDRLNPKRGYVVGNIAVISDAANRMKAEFSSEDVSRVAAWMRKTGLS